MSYDPRCANCGKPLLSEDEIEFRHCDDCADAAYERSAERRDFDYWHPPE